nr:hypothetical protein [Mycoplasmopsis bovis]
MNKKPDSLKQMEQSVYLQYKEDLLEINAENFKYLSAMSRRRDKGIYKSSKWRIKWVIKRKKWY